MERFLLFRGIMSSHRPSIFDALADKYPDLPPAEPAGPRAKASRPPVATLLVFLLGAGAVGLLVHLGESPPEPSAAREISLFQGTDEPQPAAAAVERPDGLRFASLIPSLVAPPPSRPPAAPAIQPPEPPPARPRQETPPPPAEPVEVAGCADADRRDPVKLHASPPPEYPEAARLAGRQGVVVVEARVDPAGAVEDARVLRGVTPELDQAALTAFASWRFEPATCAGEPVTGSYRTAIHFTLKAPEPPTPAPEVAGARPADVEPPVKLFTPRPVYPPSEWVAGEVTLQATIDEQGEVAGVEVLKGLSPGLDTAAVEALERWRFRPATRDGEPVRFAQVLTFRFAR